jgi:xanthine dehydrogenase YagT iron-sulfur-binding subunit
LTLRLNGRDRTFLIEPEVTLLDLIRERAGLPGTKKGCDRGQCGACTVLVNDRRVLACLALALAHAGDRVQTIEGLAEDGTLHPMQAAFIEHDALQCGYCTPGQILSAVGALREGRVGDDDAIREAMSGNICRCGAYVNIVAAVRAVREAAL